MARGPANPDTIRIVAAVIVDDGGKLLLVRKRGTTKFMQPGGKIEPHEDELAALARELEEELGCTLDMESARAFGRFQGPSANEPGAVLEASLYSARITGTPTPQNEIDEILWLTDVLAETTDLAPLTRTFVLPRLKEA
jgi:8-oxo-dGTP diphosphatase